MGHNLSSSSSSPPLPAIVNPTSFNHLYPCQAPEITRAWLCCCTCQCVAAGWVPRKQTLGWSSVCKVFLREGPRDQHLCQRREGNRLRQERTAPTQAPLNLSWFNGKPWCQNDLSELSCTGPKAGLCTLFSQSLAVGHPTKVLTLVRWVSPAEAIPEEAGS